MSTSQFALPDERKTAGASVVPVNFDAALQNINLDLEEEAIAKKAQALQMGYIDLAHTPVNPDHLSTIPEELARQSEAFPFFRIGKKLRLALTDPEKPETQALLQSLREEGYLLNLNLCSKPALALALKNYEKLPGRNPAPTLSDEINLEEFANYEKAIQNLTNFKNRIAEATSEDALNTICIGALKTEASDIHFQPEEHEVLLRFRVDGVLQDIFRFDKKTYDQLATQIKYASHLKINIKNLPQDGRFSFHAGGRRIDVRVSTLPNDFGESIVFRLLDNQVSESNFHTLGFTGDNLARVQKTLHCKDGIILVTGPTGSGKTTTLYAILNKLNSPENKIITLEDPVEYRLPHITQSQINEEEGYTFEKGLRAILRHDPDIIMVGEIRDLPTAETAAHAALTGHLVLSTLHTNDAVESVTRLLAMGLKPFILGASLKIVIAQRLVRLVCPACAESFPPTDAEKKLLTQAVAEIKKVAPDLVIEIPENLKRASGCDACSHTGYRGRLAVAQILNIDDDLREAVLAEKSSLELEKLARQKGLLTLREDVILKVCAGLTTLEEAERMTAV